MPDDMSLSRLLRRLDAAVLERSPGDVVRPLIPVRGNGRVTGAAEATGLASGAIRMVFVKGSDNLGQGCAWRHRLQWSMAVEDRGQRIVAQVVQRGLYHGCSALRQLVDVAPQQNEYRAAQLTRDACCRCCRGPEHLLSFMLAVDSTR